MQGKQCIVGVLPLGRVSPAAQQAKAPFHNLDVTPGQCELSTATAHYAPSLQVPSYAYMPSYYSLGFLVRALVRP